MALGDKPRIPDFGQEKNRAQEEGEPKEVYSFFKTLTLFLVLAIFLRASVVEAYKIPSGSMIPTLRIGDHILVSKLAYGFRLPLKKESVFQYSEPKRTDVVVFTRPDDPDTTREDESKTNIIKRVIGIPGDIVEVRGTEVLINNQILPETYTQWLDAGRNIDGNFPPQKVPEGHILLLGDNRDQSRDSRFWDYPFLDMKRVKGKAFLVYWSWDDLRRIGKVIR